MSESALVAFASLVQSDSQVREQVREAATPKHVVDLASEKGHEFTQATLMKMQADKMKHLHDDHLNGATSWGEALLLCFGGHS
ncbi:Nif11-like leader peptide family natural product precursor [Synechococcus sp. BS56D]|uniref:Nif11-like leader peptide family natural product precursor n=1 Tax=unclassified Synechococcus TaxID=2626047 RepID=UPI0010396D64|nr:MULTISPECIES: Nif11-like leader peptide family natural product precursor [unclassified Synechococcus]TCD56777.1 Nif11-like leader peptide family natural product precursor [Synechococcus sp. BS56D]TCD56907.1 Nif11-like leader peptide family natural product precursor [Synechococcus sp. BS55D]